jgi:hypothetical protein
VLLQHGWLHENKGKAAYVHSKQSVHAVLGCCGSYMPAFLPRHRPILY